MVLLKCLLWFWAFQLVVAGMLLARYGLGQAIRVVSERVARSLQLKWRTHDAEIMERSNTGRDTARGRICAAYT